MNNITCHPHHCCPLYSSIVVSLNTSYSAISATMSTSSPILVAVESKVDAFTMLSDPLYLLGCLRIILSLCDIPHISSS